MNATVAWSYQLLGPDEQRAFRRLGALPGRFPIDAAAAVLAGREDAVGDERRSAPRGGRPDRQEPSAASRDLGARLVRCTRCSKPCVRTRRSSSPRRASATTPWRGWRAIASAEASLAAEGLVGPAQAEWLDRVRDDLENYRGALTWLIERGRPAEASDIAWGLMFFWVIRGHAAEGLQWYEQILNLPSLPPAAESRALRRSGCDVVHARRTRARTHRGSTAPSRSPTAPATWTMVAQAENLFGHVEHAVGNLDAARDRFARSVEGFRALAIPWGTRECAERDGGGRPCDRRRRPGGTPAR